MAWPLKQRIYFFALVSADFINSSCFLTFFPPLSPIALSSLNDIPENVKSDILLFYGNAAIRFYLASIYARIASKCVFH